MFRYQSTHAPLAEITDALAETLRKARTAGARRRAQPRRHHRAATRSLNHADLPPGRLVLMGAPVRGAPRGASARRAIRFGPGDRSASLALEELATPRERNWSLPREVGLIAGSRSIGLGRFLADLPEPNDGTVAVDDDGLCRVRRAASCMTSVTHRDAVL